MIAPWLAVLSALELAPPVVGPPGVARPTVDATEDVREEGISSDGVLPAALGLAPEEAELVWIAPAAALPAPAAARAGGAPACSGGVCQPRVSVPGFEPRFDTRGKRTELVLLALDRAHVEPLATIVWALAATGLRLDYTPPQLDGGLVSGHAGWGHLQLLLRWRIDAMNAPVWPERRR